MTKRALKRMVREGGDAPQHEARHDDSKIRRLNIDTRMGDRNRASWSPAGAYSNDDGREPGRDQGYVKTIKPKSEGQKALMEAMDSKNLVMALGPPARARPIWPSPRRLKPWKPARSAASSCRAPRSRLENPSAICRARWKTSSRPICVPCTTPYRTG
jgi:hypothetical protein